MDKNGSHNSLNFWIQNGPQWLRTLLFLLLLLSDFPFPKALSFLKRSQ